jgi:REP element-mobilizing transposase RayT
MRRNPDTVTFWRGRLPHWEVVNGRYFVTIHLAGAIPREGQDRIRLIAADLERMSTDPEDGRLQQQRRIFAEMESWLDRSDAVRHLEHPAIAKMVIEAIEHCRGRVWDMLGYVVMPNHLHLFFELIGEGLKHHLEQFKRWTGHEAAKLIELPDGQFWQDEWFDHWSRSPEEDAKIIKYIQQNPVKAGLVKEHKDWPHGGWR